MSRAIVEMCIYNMLCDNEMRTLWNRRIFLWKLNYILCYSVGMKLRNFCQITHKKKKNTTWTLALVDSNRENIIWQSNEIKWQKANATFYSSLATWNRLKWNDFFFVCGWGFLSDDCWEWNIFAWASEHVLNYKTQMRRNRIENRQSKSKEGNMKQNMRINL